VTAADPVRAARALRGAAAGVLVLEGIAVLFVPRGIAQTEGGLGAVRLTLLLALAVVRVLASGVQRRPQGLVIATALQVPLLLTGLLNSVMWFVAGVFVLIWLYLLQVRKELLGSPFGEPAARSDDDPGTGPA
jgi:prolipoprotein diacylglyceryltransferase